MTTRFCIAAALLLSACGPSPEAKEVRKDPTTEAWYADTLKQLNDMNVKAADLFHAGRKDDASAVILKAEPLSNKLLGVTQPTFAAMAAASDLDDLYGQMLLSNHNYGWARMFFQKNLARWKHWTPRTDQTIDRERHAQQEIADCDKFIPE